MATDHATVRRGSSPSQSDIMVQSRCPPSVSPAEADRRAQIAAAKTRVTLDKRTGDETPEWIIACPRKNRSRTQSPDQRTRSWKTIRERVLRVVAGIEGSRSSPYQTFAKNDWGPFAFQRATPVWGRR